MKLGCRLIVSKQVVCLPCAILFLLFSNRVIVNPNIAVVIGRYDQLITISYLCMTGHVVWYLICSHRYKNLDCDEVERSSEQSELQVSVNQSCN